MKFKFSFYGWLAVMTILIGIGLGILHISIPFLSWFIGGYIYAQVFHKKIDANYIVNVVFTLIATAIALFFLAILVGATIYGLVQVI